MTTKRKIIAGFGFLVILLMAMAVIGYRGLGTSTEYFVEYDRMANLNVNLSDIASSLYQAAYNTERFIADFDLPRADSAEANMNAAIRLSDESMQYFKSDERKAAATENRKDLDDYLSAVKAVKTDMQAFKKEYSENTRKALDEMHAELAW